jgi:hypothetical protein
MKYLIASAVMSLSLFAPLSHAAGAKKFSGEIVLATAVSQPSQKTIKGVTWNCEGTRCTAAPQYWSGLDSFIKQCRVVATEMGPLVSFRSGSRVTDSGDIATCNRLAQKS